MKSVWMFLLFISLTGFCSAQQTTDSTQAGKVRWNYKRTETKLYEKGLFVDGKRHGVWQFKDTTGSIVVREKYIHGAYRWTVYYKKGKIVGTRDYKGNVTKKPDCGC